MQPIPRPTKESRVNFKRKLLIKQKDKEFSMQKDRFCEICKRPGNTDPHHIIPRRHMAFRFDPRNRASLCRSCHMKAQQNIDGLNDALMEAHGLPQDFASYRFST